MASRPSDFGTLGLKFDNGALMVTSRRTTTSPPLPMLYKGASSHQKMQEDHERPSMPSDSDSDLNPGSGDNGEGGVASTSENANAIYEGRAEPERDLMKEMMRTPLSKLASNV